MSQPSMHNKWWVIHEDDILAMLHAVAGGEDPDVVLAEHYANSDHEHVEGD